MMSSENGLGAGGDAALALGSGVYIDVENLHPDGQTMIESLLDGWPDEWPGPSRITLYTRADQAELWRVWAEHRFGDVPVVAHGTQHFSWSSTKNSADIAIAINAMTDLVLGRVRNVVVLSDDSDFISLYVAIRDELGIPRLDGRPPFLWAVTDRKGPLSTTVEQFFPPVHLHVVSPERVRLSRAAALASGTARPSEAPRRPPVHVQPSVAPVREPVQAPAPSREPVQAPAPTPAVAVAVAPEPPAAPAASPSDTWQAIARTVVKELPVGVFKSADAQAIIKKHWPGHQMASASSASFGTDFRNRVWPVLQDMGVRIPNHNRKPIQYEMTVEAKEALAEAES